MREPESRDKREVETPTSFLVSYPNLLICLTSGVHRAAFKLDIMEENKRNEELQSRRDFFKKAAKGVLPILGAVVLASAPGIVKAVEKAPMGCDYGCSLACRDGCQGTCQGRCVRSCLGGCDEGCQGQCRYSCSGSCYHSSK